MDIDKIIKKRKQELGGYTQEEIDNAIENLFLSFDEMERFKATTINFDKIQKYNRLCEIIKELEKTSTDFSGVDGCKPTIDNKYATVWFEYHWIIDFNEKQKKLLIEAITLADEFSISANKEIGRIHFGIQCMK